MGSTLRLCDRFYFETDATFGTVFSMAKSVMAVARKVGEVKLWEKPVDTESPGPRYSIGTPWRERLDRPEQSRLHRKAWGVRDQEMRTVWFPPLYSLPSCHGKGTKTSAESFLIDTGIGEASIWSVAQRPLTKGVDFPDPRRHGCHW